MENVKIKGHKGTWYSISSKKVAHEGKTVQAYLMEHETYGEDADHVIIDKEGNIIAEGLKNGFDDLDI